MTGLESVAIFWDYENCRPASSVSGYSITSSIRRAAHNFGSVKLFKAYLELSESSKSLNLRSELQCSGVSLTDCPHNGHKDVADKMILVDMLSYAIDNPAPSTIILISGDRDFAYAVSVLRLRRYRVVIMAPSVPNVHISLKSQASVFLDWNTDIMGRATREPSIHPAGLVNCESTLASPPRSPEFNPEHNSSYPLAPPLSLTRPCPDCPVVTIKDGSGASHGRTSEAWLSDPIKPTKNYADDCLPRKSWSQTTDPSGDCSSITQFPTVDKPEYLEGPTTARKRAGSCSQISDLLVCSTARASQKEWFPASMGDSYVETQRTDSLPAIEVDNAKPLSVGVSPTSTTKTHAFVERRATTNAENSSLAYSSHAHGLSYLPVTSLSKVIPTASTAPPISSMPKQGSSFMPTPSYPRPVGPFDDVTDIDHDQIVITSSSNGRPPEPAVQHELDATEINHYPPNCLPAKVVPSKFRILVEKLEYQHTKGVTHVPRSSFAESLTKQDKLIYEKAGVAKFRQYVAQAEKAGIVQLGMDSTTGCWISLHPDWRRMPGS